MSKRALLIWAIVWIILGILAALSTVKELMAKPDANYIFAAGLTLYRFYNGIRGIKRYVNKDNSNENDENGETSCSGG